MPGFFVEQMMMIANIGVEIDLPAINDNLAQQSRRMEMVQRIVNSGQRYGDAFFQRNSMNLFRRDVFIAAIEQKLSQSQPLPRRAQTRILQKGRERLILLCLFRIHLKIMQQKNAAGK